MVLSGRAGELDRLRAFERGVDEYVVKPFSYAELRHRIAAVLRRTHGRRLGGRLRVGDLSLDPVSREVRLRGHRIALSQKEFALLEAFMRRPGHVLTRYDLLEHAWDYGYERRSNVVDVYVRYLREKIDRPFGRSSLETVRGAGYRLRTSE